ncbi:MAG: sensor histidine kinase [Planctomycetota bacterium]
MWIGATAIAAASDAAVVTALLGVGGGLWLARADAVRRTGAVANPPGDAAPPVGSGADRGGWQQQALHATLAALSDGVLVLDADDRVLAVNEPARGLLGVAPADAPRPLAALVDWPQLLTVLRDCRRGAPGRPRQTFEAERSGGAEARTLGVAVSVRGDGLAVVVLRDLSRLRQLESHRRDFVANVSHELKTPLAAIQGFVETLLDDPDVPAPTRQRFLEKVHKQVGRLATLVADLLTLSRLDEHSPEPADPCEVATLVREVGRDLQPFADKRRVRLELELPGAPVWVAAEREALRQVVSNLVDNAIKYTPEDGAVTVRMVPNGERVEVAVADTGIGLSEVDCERVFERFYRVDRARSRELGGTGLGLSIVKNTVQGLGGEVGVHSRLGHGSTFWVRLPLTAAR